MFEYIFSFFYNFWILISIIQITYQIEVIGFYQQYQTTVGGIDIYNWVRCNDKCYTCNEGLSGTNQNCLSCNPKQGRYFLYGDIERNCYTKEELDPSKIYFLDKKQIPNKWVECDQSCKSCSTSISLGNNGGSTIQMNCDECKDNTYIKVNTFCYPKDNSDSSLGFIVNSVTKHCGDYNDDETGQQLGIYDDGGNQCIIKPESSYFPFNDTTHFLKTCGENCLSCEGVPGQTDPDKIICNKCKENYIFYENRCQCPPYLAKETNTNNCVNCKYSPQGPYNKEGNCVATKDPGYLLINTTYNILSNCKRPCLTCDSNGRCETCAPNYFFNKIAYDNNINNNYELCLTYNECNELGYPNIYFSVCIFCDQSNNKYKVVNSEDCVSMINIDGYYHKKQNYPALAKCHERCATCSDIIPKGDKIQRCLTCQPEFDYNTSTTNCDDRIIIGTTDFEEEIKCENMIYYIDEAETDINEKLSVLMELIYVLMDMNIYYKMKIFVLKNVQIHLLKLILIIDMIK